MMIGRWNEGQNMEKRVVGFKVYFKSQVTRFSYEWHVAFGSSQRRVQKLYFEQLARWGSPFLSWWWPGRKSLGQDRGSWECCLDVLILGFLLDVLWRCLMNAKEVSQTIYPRNFRRGLGTPGLPHSVVGKWIRLVTVMKVVVMINNNNTKALIYLRNCAKYMAALTVHLVELQLQRA